MVSVILNANITSPVLTFPRAPQTLIFYTQFLYQLTSNSVQQFRTRMTRTASTDVTLLH